MFEYYYDKLNEIWGDQDHKSKNLGAMAPRWPPQSLSGSATYGHAWLLLVAVTKDDPR